jgi:putative cardiolipin synthase
MKVLAGVLLGVLLLLVVAVLLPGRLHPLPPLDGRSPSRAFTDTADTRLGRAVAPQVAAHPGLSGVYALPLGRDAFAARLSLIQAAQRSIDAQYYIWRDDLTGHLINRALYEAAERGVRVRLLLDDNRTAGLDPLLAVLDAHPNVEIRLFNPFTLRRFRLLQYASDFSRVNRRMHNKSFTVDNQVTIIGGRNVGDEYFDATTEGTLTFADLDVLAVGPVVADVSQQFDGYWASRSAYPADRLLPPAGSAEELLAPRPGEDAWLASVTGRPLVDALLAGTLELEWAPARMISDHPDKGLGLAAPETLFPEVLKNALGMPESELDLVSPYFVPTETGLRTFASLAERGVRIRILVNSLEATDVAAVHAGYAKWRKPLLASGIELFEMPLIEPGTGPERLTGRFGSSATSVHAKTIAADRSRIFIGSFNLDPRSANLNTELGFVIESETLATRVAEVFDRDLPEAAYRVHLSEGGKVYWTEWRNGETVRHDTEPGTSAWQRGVVRFLSWLPIDWLL